jgi:hypothetical protein
MSKEMFNGEIMMQTNTQLAAYLPFGEGKIGISHALTSDEERAEFAESLTGFKRAITKANTADCVDDRFTLSFADGTTDLTIIRNRIVPQLAGGEGLALTKALVAADATVVKGAKDMTSAYLMVADLLDKLGEEDGGHAVCGASKFVEGSVAARIEEDSLLTVASALTSADDDARRFFDANVQTMWRRLEDGFYGTWSASWHEGYLADTVPHNFATLRGDENDHETHGHHASGLNAIRQTGFGFAKNEFIERTGKEAFGYTAWKADQLANSLGVDDEERYRIRLGFAIDSPAVLNKLVIKGFPAFLDQAA